MDQALRAVPDNRVEVIETVLWRWHLPGPAKNRCEVAPLLIPNDAVTPLSGINSTTALIRQNNKN
jgi:hypothetical protein